MSVKPPCLTPRLSDIHQTEIAPLHIKTKHSPAQNCGVAINKSS
jgi:hypothetical protein